MKAAAPAERGLLAAVREVFLGNELDLTEAPLGRAVLVLAIPMVLEMAMESLFGLVDILFVSRVGTHAVATVGLTETILAVTYSVGTGAAMAATAVVARRVGEKSPEGAARSAVQSVLLALLAGLVLSLPEALLARPLLQALGAAPEVVAVGVPYARVMLGGQTAILLLFVLNGAFRGAGDASMSLRSLWLANLINIVLDPCLIFGLGFFPRLGVMGAAVATTTGRSLAVLYQLYWLLYGGKRLQVRARHLHYDRVVFGTALRKAVSSTAQFLIGTASWAAITRLVARFGSDAVAGYTVALRIIMVALLPAWGMANAASTLVGQNLGANRPDRAEQAVWRIALYNFLFLGGVAGVFLVFARPLLALVTPEPGVLAHAVTCLRYVAGGYGLYAYGMVMLQAFNGAGDTRTPLWVNVVCYWLVQIPAAILFSRTRLGLSGVFLAIPVGEGVNAVLGVLMFRTGRWKTVKV